MLDPTNLEWLEILFETVESEDCLESPRQSGRYMNVKIGKKQVAGHVLICTWENGPRPPKHLARHTCGWSRCLNRNHLRWGTSKDNYADAVSHGTSTRGARVWKSKIAADDAREIFRRLALGETCASIAPDYGMSTAGIAGMKAGHRNWKWVLDGD